MPQALMKPQKVQRRPTVKVSMETAGEKPAGSRVWQCGNHTSGCLSRLKVVTGEMQSRRLPEKDKELNKQTKKKKT